jgi:hypothetical protein
LRASKTRAFKPDQKLTHNTNVPSKHAKLHYPPLSCQVTYKHPPYNCQAPPVSYKRDLDRHYWSHHPGWAAQNGIPHETAKCPAHGCDYKGRRDNVKRHREQAGH